MDLRLIVNYIAPHWIENTGSKNDNRTVTECACPERKMGKKNDDSFKNNKLDSQDKIYEHFDSREILINVLRWYIIFYPRFPHEVRCVNTYNL